MDVIEDYNNTVKMYAQYFAEDRDRDADSAGCMVDMWTDELATHLKSKPVVGNPSEEWVKEKEKLERTLNASKEKLDAIFESCKGGENNPAAIRYGKECVAEQHPELHERYQKIVDTVLPDPIEVYKNAFEGYQKIFVQNAQENLLAEQQLVAAWTSCWKARCNNGPTMFDDIVSLGKASKKWEGDLNEIQDQLRHHQTRAQAAWGIVNTGPSHPDAVKFAEDSVKRHNPDIEQNFQDKVTRIKNAEQAERENDLKERMAKIDTPKRQSETVVLTR